MKVPFHKILLKIFLLSASSKHYGINEFLLISNHSRISTRRQVEKRKCPQFMTI